MNPRADVLDEICLGINDGSFGKRGCSQALIHGDEFNDRGTRTKCKHGCC